MTKLQVAVLGIGGMGSGIAGRLLAAGHEVTVYNRTAAAADELVARGAKRAASPAEAVVPGGIAITMLANDDAVEAVTAAGPDGFLEPLGSGGLHISMSTITPALGERLAERHRAVGGEFLGSPVFGRPDAAAAGKLWIALSGSDAAKARAKPVHDATLARHLRFRRKAEAALVAKIGGNFLIAAAMEAMGEAFALMEKSGVDARRFHEMISQTLFASIIYQNYGRFILDRKFERPGSSCGSAPRMSASRCRMAAAARRPCRLPACCATASSHPSRRGMAISTGPAIALGARADAGLAD
ncbi:MAG: NAD(P)-dependent oxidoreductase [Aliidongia sp.]